MSYKVLVDDNFHYMDESERYTLGQFDTLNEAIEACKRIVDRDLNSRYEPGMTADELFSHYTSFGDDPFIVAEGGGADFSAWRYAETRCAELAQAQP
jgi:hypothetical protein